MYHPNTVVSELEFPLQILPLMSRHPAKLRVGWGMDDRFFVSFDCFCEDQILTPTPNPELLTKDFRL